jgi:TetR/AcrR family transcriptional regulator
MPRPRTDIRPRILEAARERFAQSGVDASSLRSIAADAGTSIGMIYYYFPTKDDLFLAVVEDVYGALLSDLDAALGTSGDFASSALSLYRRIAAVSPLELQVIRLVAREAFTSGERLLSLLPRFSRGHIALIFNAVRRGVQAGELRTDLHPAVLMAATLSIGAVPQLALRVMGKYLPIAPPGAAELTRQLADALLNGIGAKK